MLWVLEAETKGWSERGQLWVKTLGMGPENFVGFVTGSHSVDLAGLEITM